MAIDDKLLTSFADAINNPGEEDRSNKPKVSYVYAQAVSKMTSNNVVNVKIDGSEIRCPVNSNVTVDEGDRVLVMLRNHNATVVGNATTPSTTVDYMKSGDGKSLIIDQVRDYISEALDDLKGSLFPVGSTYITIVKVSPATFLGGTWTLLDEGYALMSVKNDQEGGQYDSITSNTKTVSGVPAHTHTISGAGTVSTNEAYLDHYHKMPIYKTVDEGYAIGQGALTKGYGISNDKIGFLDRVIVGVSRDASEDYYMDTNSVWKTSHNPNFSHSHTVDLSSITIGSGGDGDGKVNVTPKNFKVYVWYRTA